MKDSLEIILTITISFIFGFSSHVFYLENFNTSNSGGTNPLTSVASPPESFIVGSIE